MRFRCTQWSAPEFFEGEDDIEGMVTFAIQCGWEPRVWHEDNARISVIFGAEDETLEIQVFKT